MSGCKSHIMLIVASTSSSVLLSEKKKKKTVMAQISLEPKLQNDYEAFQEGNHLIEIERRDVANLRRDQVKRSLCRSHPVLFLVSKDIMYWPNKI